MVTELLKCLEHLENEAEDNRKLRRELLEGRVIALTSQGTKLLIG